MIGVMKLDTISLLLLEHDDDAKRLIVTWPHLLVAADARISIFSDDEPNAAELLGEWAGISGVDLDDIAKIVPMLVRLSFVNPDGSIPAEVRGFIAAEVRKFIGRGHPPPPRPRRSNIAGLKSA